MDRNGVAVCANLCRNAQESMHINGEKPAVFAAFVMTACSDCKLTSAFSALLNAFCTKAATVHVAVVTTVMLPNYANRCGFSPQSTMHGENPSLCRNLSAICTERWYGVIWCKCYIEAIGQAGNWEYGWNIRLCYPAARQLVCVWERERERVCVLEVPMAEFEEDGSLPPLNPEDTAVPSDNAAGKTHCEVSVLNGDCGISENMVGSGSLVAPGSQTGVDNANTSAGLDTKSEIPRRSSIIKVNTEVQASVLYHSFWWASVLHIYAGHRMLEVTVQSLLCTSLVLCTMIAVKCSHNRSQ